MNSFLLYAIGISRIVKWKNGLVLLSENEPALIKIVFSTADLKLRLQSQYDIKKLLSDLLDRRAVHIRMD